MDPDATWTMLVDTYREEDWPQVVELSDALLSWLDRGGFTPQKLSQSWGIDTPATKVMVVAFCKYANGIGRGEVSDAP